MLRRNQDIQQVFVKQEIRFRGGPQRNRTCNDICCFLTFIILILTFTSIGLYYLITSCPMALRANPLPQILLSQPLTIIKQLLIKYWPIICAMFILSGILAIIFGALMRYCTKCVVYALIVSSFIVLAGIGIVAAVGTAWGVVVAAGVAVFGLGCFVGCYRRHIATGITLLKASTQFLKSRPTVYLTPISISLLSVLFLLFWLLTLICIQYNSALLTTQNKQPTKQLIFFIYWIFMIVFMGIFFYYVLVFIIASMCACWYYGWDEDGFGIGWAWFGRASVGSLTFVSLVGVGVKVLQGLGVGRGEQGNCCGVCCRCCGACCQCFLSCCLQQIEYLILVMNRHSVIAMSLTGSPYLESSQTALSILFKDLPLFTTTSTISTLTKYSALIFCSGIPTLLSYFLLNLIYWKQQINSYNITIFIIFIFFICIFINYYFVSVCAVALDSVFFCFCLERRYRELGFNLDRGPGILRDLEQTGRFDYQGPKSAERLF